MHSLSRSLFSPTSTYFCILSHVVVPLGMSLFVSLSCSVCMSLPIALCLYLYMYASPHLFIYAFFIAVLVALCPPPFPSRPPGCRLLFRYRDANVHVFTRDPWRLSFKYNVRMPWYARLVLAKNVIWHDVLEADQTSKVLIAVGEKNKCVTACFVQHVRCA